MTAASIEADLRTAEDYLRRVDGETLDSEKEHLILLFKCYMELAEAKSRIEANRFDWLDELEWLDGLEADAPWTLTPPMEATP
jgi:hypothetical protein